MSWSAYDYLAAQQRDRCAICGRKPGYLLVVDHDHAVAARYSRGASVRGLLCHLDNTLMAHVDAGTEPIAGEVANYVESYARRLTAWVSAEVAMRVAEHLEAASGS